jgi:hypothetical protein
MREKLLISGLGVGFAVFIGSGVALASSVASSVWIGATSERHNAPLRLAQTGVNFDTAAPGVGGHYGHLHSRSDPNPRRPPGGAASLDKPEYAKEQNPQRAQSGSASETQDAPTFTPAR